ncbi:MAG: PQQ-binding-like beta-propeller repeat protein [Pirellulales bacterium]
MANVTSTERRDDDIPSGQPTTVARAATQPDPHDAAAARPRIWPAVVLIGIFWIGQFLLTQSDLVITRAFMINMVLMLLVPLALVVWWLTNRRIPWRHRWTALAAAVAGGIVCVLVTRNTLGAMGAIFIGMMLLWTGWILWLVLSQRAMPRTRYLGLIGTIAAVWAGVSLLRVDGIDGAMRPDLHLRWTPTNEELYIAERAKTLPDKPAADAPADAPPLVYSAGDWPCFRGPGFLGEQEHPAIATDWAASPPKELWRRRVGPAWSSFVVIGDRLFTHEQRDKDEATVCLDAATGQEIWSHVDKARFWDGQAGAGPRGTPTFHDGRLYTYGATGILNCLDAATGKRHWTRDVAAETAAPLPMWGFSSSPLVVDGLVVVFAGGPKEKGIAAYQADSGEPVWTAPCGPISYSTAQVVTAGGQPQVLLMSDTGVVSVEPATGKRMWSYDADATGIWRVVQPRQLADGKVLVGSEDMGLRLLNVAHEGEAWNVSEQWTTRSMCPAYNDYVIVDGVAYGFDKGIFCAVDLADGKRLWKGGRFGYGQVVLLKPQNVMIVLGEHGEVALLAANPQKLEELGRFEAIEGKTWNHPVVVRGRLFVRNDSEMAAFGLAPAP